MKNRYFSWFDLTTIMQKNVFWKGKVVGSLKWMQEMSFCTKKTKEGCYSKLAPKKKRMRWNLRKICLWSTSFNSAVALKPNMRSDIRYDLKKWEVLAVVDKSSKLPKIMRLLRLKISINLQNSRSVQIVIMKSEVKFLRGTL